MPLAHLLLLLMKDWKFGFRAEEVGYVVPTEVQEQSLPLLLSGQDCILHAQVVVLSLT